jgi:predicted transcriptional regulator
MAKMNRRTTFALDEETMIRLRKLAAVWHVSQAEVVRKAIKTAESDFNTATEEKLERLRQYHKREEVKIEIADAYLDEVAENRSSWGRD